MSPANRFRLFVFCLWLLGGHVNCESTQRGYVPHVQAGHVPMGVYDRDYKTWSELPIFRAPAAGSKTSDVGRGQSGSIYSTQEDHTTNPKPSQILSSYPVSSESQYSSVPESRVNHFKSGLSSASRTRGRSKVVYNLSGNKAFASPYGRTIHRAKSDSVLSTGVVKVPPSIYRARTKLTGGFSSVPEDQATVGFERAPIHTRSTTARPDIQYIKSSLKSKSYKTSANLSRPNIHPLHQQESHRRTRPKVSGSHPVHVFPYSFDRFRVNPLQKVVKKDKETESIIKGHSPDSAGKGDTQMSYPTWSPRIYGSDVMPEPRGYAHVHHLRPDSDKTRAQATSAAGRKFSETLLPSIQQNQGSYSHDSARQGFGFGGAGSTENDLNLNYNSRGQQSSRWHPPLQDRAQTLVQGKFKPFQRLPTGDDLHAHTHASDSETASTQTSATATNPSSLNSTGIMSTATHLSSLNSTDIMSTATNPSSLNSTGIMSTATHLSSLNSTDFTSVATISSDLNSTGITSTATNPSSLNSTGIMSLVLPLINGKLSTKSASRMWSEGQSEDLAEVGPSFEQDKAVDQLVARPLEMDQYEV